MIRALGGILWIFGTAFVLYMLLWRLWLLDTVEFIVGLLCTLLLMVGLYCAKVWKAGQARDAERAAARAARSQGPPPPLPDEDASRYE